MDPHNYMFHDQFKVSFFSLNSINNGIDDTFYAKIYDNKIPKHVL